MLTLMLLRHAKAIGHGLVDDFDRGLTDRGEADAHRLGAHVAELGVLPDLAIVSSAARTRQTFEHFVKGVGAAIPARFDDDLYNASDRQLRDTLKPIEASTRTLMLVGHNPGIMDVAVRLGRDGDIIELARLRNRFPPCALAVIGFDFDDWRDARAGGGRLDLLLLPEDIAALD